MPQKQSSDDIVLDTNAIDSGSRRATQDPFAGFRFEDNYPPRPKIEVPPAPPTMPKDPDKALTNFALGVLRFNRWPCHEGQDYRSFIMDVQFKTPTRGVISNDRFCVYADSGLLYFEQCILELPELPKETPLLEAINQINLRSIGSTFSLDPSNGVCMRHTMIPRTRDEGYMTSTTIVQTIRQMFYDRRCALSLLRQVVESRSMDPVSVAKAFERPAAPGPIAALTLAQVENLANFAGYYTHTIGSQIFLARSVMPSDQCPVRLNVGNGFMRGETTIGEVKSGISSRLKQLIKNKMTSANSRVYESINSMNLDPGLLRYVVSMKSILATAMSFPTDKDMTVEQFKIFAEGLLEPELGNS